ncbi:P-loop containing nucleoside triphosphate hydrolase protein [Gymnopus androsaceus JB14]|uniref:P-loop containing nucleoside triphosphate hydrolase protein n=1 Tax=Gymnopus androsaceus JB14 TaxID=1447944 RepID=A0A6A4I4P8_9AGAR|nr:P-loop containing nucleoside triphosphate hydrolase protein [Gymnopus androsaceus JB14]
MKRKLVVGDGKDMTCLLIVYAENRFPEAYIPTVFENYVTQMYNVTQEEYHRLRPFSYPESDVILIMFSIDFPTTHFCENIPLLVGTKTDLQNDNQTKRMLAAQGQTAISPQQSAGMAKYIECSAKTGRALKESVKGRRGKKRPCIVI